MIRPVDEIPMNAADKRKSYREQIRNDIREAMDKGINKFEFVGDYKYKYLAQYAREEADRIVWKAAREIVKDKDVFIGSYDVRCLNPIRITSVKGEKKDEPRVFCRIDFTGFEEQVMAIGDAKLAVRREHDGKKKLKMEANDVTETFDFTGELP